MHQTANFLNDCCYPFYVMNAAIVRDNNTVDILAIEWHQVGLTANGIK